jgi:hypothetical protein
MPLLEFRINPVQKPILQGRSPYMTDETAGARQGGRRKAGGGDRGRQQGRGAMLLALSLIEDLEQNGVIAPGSATRIVVQAAEKAKAPGIKAVLLEAIGEGGERPRRGGGGRKAARKAARRAGAGTGKAET